MCVECLIISTASGCRSLHRSGLRWWTGLRSSRKESGVSVPCLLCWKVRSSHETVFCRCMTSYGLASWGVGEGAYGRWYSAGA